MQGGRAAAAVAGKAKNVGMSSPAMMTKIFGSITRSTAADAAAGGSFSPPVERFRKEHARTMRAPAMRSMARKRPPKR